VTAEKMEFGRGVTITGVDDDDALKTLGAFLTLSRSATALVSNECISPDGERSLLVYVRKIDGQLACMGVAMADGITRRGVVKSMRDAGVKVESFSGVSIEETGLLH
jgi:hypothetical protein